MASMWVSGGSSEISLLGGGVGADGMKWGSPVVDSSAFGSPGSAVASTAQAARDTANTIPAIPAIGFNMQRFYVANWRRQEVRGFADRGNVLRLTGSRGEPLRLGPTR